MSLANVVSNLIKKADANTGAEQIADNLQHASEMADQFSDITPPPLVMSGNHLFVAPNSVICTQAK